MARSILWFRRDLRLADHPALAAAATEGDVVPLFVWDPLLVDRSGLARLHHLRASLDALGGPIGGLVERTGDPVDVVPAVAAEAGVATVHVSLDTNPYGRARDAEVARRLAADGRALVATGSPYAVEPGAVRTKAGTPFAVFTPFRRAWEATGWDAPGPAPLPDWVVLPGAPRPPLPPLGDVELPAAGEWAAHARLDAFLAGPADRYDLDRNDPGVEGTSRLSIDLRWGTLHPRQVLDRLGPSRAHDVFRSELAWREFYADVLWHRPASARQSLQPAMARVPVDTDAAARARFRSWAHGRTGYPIVDAGMRQLAATGWMHNRVRMITASFLVKDLHLPWQWGARHFMRHLVDGDLASNQHGWQWTAGTGTDAAPYFRVFNPVGQGERFDPGGRYVRRWVPELGGVEDRYVHAPWTSPRGLPLGYEPPMVDHAEERAEALRRYQLTRG
jgi:deoxyribodipyrimidine photo-lyase